jgi:hypothetical protein
MEPHIRNFQQCRNKVVNLMVLLDQITFSLILIKVKWKHQLHQNTRLLVNSKKKGIIQWSLRKISQKLHIWKQMGKNQFLKMADQLAVLKNWLWVKIEFHSAHQENASQTLWDQTIGITFLSKPHCQALANMVPEGIPTESWAVLRRKHIDIQWHQELSSAIKEMKNIVSY